MMKGTTVAVIAMIVVAASHMRMDNSRVLIKLMPSPYDNGRRQEVSSESELDAAEELSSTTTDATINNSSLSDIQPYLDRGSNFLWATSGCDMATWVWATGPRLFLDCSPRYIQRQRKLEGNEGLVQEYDTVYVPTKLLQHFVNEGSLDKITKPFVLITGGYQNSKNNMQPAWVVRMIKDNPYVLKWFCQSIDTYIPENYWKELVPKNKLIPFPFGLQPKTYKPGEPDPKAQFREAFDRHLHLPPKTRDMFVGYFSNHTNPKRKSIPSGPKLPKQEYYDRMAESRYVLSPDGDRPECYRHYEAIAFGAIPITELNPMLYSHFEKAPIVFNNTDWTIEAADVDRLVGLKPKKVERSMIFEEYWMEYVERIVNKPLRWWDRLSEQKVQLKEFVNFTTTTFPPPPLEVQVKDLQEQLRKSNIAIETQNERINELTSRLEESNRAIEKVSATLFKKEENISSNKI